MKTTTEHGRMPTSLASALTFVSAALRLVVTVAVGLAFVVTIVLVRAGDLRRMTPGAPTSLAADAQLELAASSLEDATKASGPGFVFTVVTRSSLDARPDGPRIKFPDPADPTKALKLVDRYYLGSSIAAGIVTPDGWFIQMRQGPQTETDAPDFDHAQLTLAGLVTAGEVWRNDGEGWYQTDIAPSIGLDPVTLSLLPKLLREATDPALAGEALDGADVRSVVTATGSVANAPGLIAVDLGPRTELTGPIELQIDDQGRLCQLRAHLRNTNETTFDLIVETTIRIDWSTPPGGLPTPEPTTDPDAAAPAGLG